MVALNRLYALSLLLKSWDILTTTIAVVWVGHSSIEGNPVVRYSIDQLGLVPAMLLNFALFHIMVSAIHHKKGIATLAFVTGLLAFVVTNNIIGLFVISK